AHASVDESVKWHRKMGHVNYKNMNRLAKVSSIKPFIRPLMLVYNVPNKRVEETMNLRFLEEKPNVQGLGHEWYFNLDYLTDTLGYKHVQANQSAGTQGVVTNPAGTQDADLDSDCDEQVIIELARLKGQAQRATSYAESLGLGFANDAEEFYTQASAKTVPPGCIPVPTGNIPVPPGSLPVPTGSIPVPTSNTVPTTRFPSPSDLGNHDPSPGIFSSSSYDDEFGAAINNVSSTVEVSPVVTTRINTIHPQSLIIRDPTSAVQTRSKEEVIDYDEVFAPVARIEAICLFLAFASYMGFMVYQMDVKSAFLYERIDEEVYVTQPKGFLDPQHPKKVYKLVKALYGLHQALRAWYATLSTFLLKHGYRRGTIDKTLFLKKNNRDIILGEFQKSAMGELTFFLGLQVQQRPDEAVKKIFKYLKGQPKLGLWYPKESLLVLEAYSDSDYARANKDRKSKTGGYQFLGRRLLWPLPQLRQNM
nr:putative ribonuclease H-like domain-containing protein [Tanacetum cinerariifolium]